MPNGKRWDYVRHVEVETGHIDVPKVAREVKVGDRLLPSHLRFVQPGKGMQPALTVDYQLRSKVPVAVAVTFTATKSAPRVRDKHLHTATLDVWAVEVFALVAVRIVQERPGLRVVAVVDTEAPDPAAIRALASTSAGAPRKLDEGFLRDVADVYLNPEHKHPTAEVARAFEVRPRTAAHYVSRARALGLIPPTTPGKATR